MRTAIVMGLLILVAGCTAPPPDCTGEDCATATTTPTFSTSPPFPPPIDLVPKNATRLLHFDNCTGTLGETEVAYDAVDPFVPDDFRILGYAPDLARLVFEAIECKRITNQTRVLEHAAYLITFVWVTPLNESWALEGSSRYILDAYISDEEFAAELQGWNATVKNAVFGIAEAPLAGGPGVKWDVTSGSERFTFEYHPFEYPAPFDAGGSSTSRSMFFGESPYLRVDSISKVLQSDLTEGGVLTPEGESKYAKIVGSPRVPYVSGYFPKFDEVWAPFESRFEGGN